MMRRRLTILIALIALLPGFAARGEVAFGIFPIVGSGTSRADMRRPGGVTDDFAYSMMDYGAGGICLARIEGDGVIAAATKAGAVLLPEDLSAAMKGDAIAAVRGALDAQKVPTDWLTDGMTGREIARKFAAVCQMAQRLQGVGYGKIQDPKGDPKSDDAAQQARLEEALASFAIDAAAVQPGDTFEKVSDLVIAAWEEKPIYLNGEDLKTGDKPALDEAVKQPIAFERFERPKPEMGLVEILSRLFTFSPSANAVTTDAFTGTNGTAITTYDAHWIVNAGGYNIRTNAICGSTAGNNLAHWNATWNNDQYAKGTGVAVPSTSRSVGVAVRCNVSADSGYSYRAWATADQRIVSKDVTGTYTSLGSTGAGHGITTNDTLELDVVSTTLTPKYNGSNDSLISPFTDSTFSSGYPGLAFEAGNIDTRLDDWEGGNLGSSVSIPVLSHNYQLQRQD